MEPDPNLAAMPVRVVVVEDNEDDRELLQLQLRKAKLNHQVRFLADGKTALEFLKLQGQESTTQLMAIFLDLNLPSVSGVELLRVIRDLPTLNKVPVVVMTSSNSPKDLVECRNLNVLHYAQKPITFDVFSKAVASVFHPVK